MHIRVYEILDSENFLCGKPRILTKIRAIKFSNAQSPRSHGEIESARNTILDIRAGMAKYLWCEIFMSLFILFYGPFMIFT